MISIEKLIYSFIEAEYIANLTKWDLSIDDEKAIETGQNVKSCFHSSFKSSSFGRKKGLFDDEDFKDFAPIKKSRVQKRPLFKIEKYQNPEIGGNLQRILTDNIIYLCYTGSDEKNRINSQGYSRVFAIAETNEGLKIFEEIVYSNGKPMESEEGRADYNFIKDYIIQDYGELLEIKKIQAPEEEFSLKEYNSK